MPPKAAKRPREEPTSSTEKDPTMALCSVLCGAGGCVLDRGGSLPLLPAHPLLCLLPSSTECDGRCLRGVALTSCKGSVLRAAPLRLRLRPLHRVPLPLSLRQCLEGGGFVAVGETHYGSGTLRAGLPPCLTAPARALLRGFPGVHLEALSGGFPLFDSRTRRLRGELHVGERAAAARRQWGALEGLAPAGLAGLLLPGAAAEALRPSCQWCLVRYPGGAPGEEAYLLPAFLLAHGLSVEVGLRQMPPHERAAASTALRDQTACLPSVTVEVDGVARRLSLELEEEESSMRASAALLFASAASLTFHSHSGTAA